MTGRNHWLRIFALAALVVGCLGENRLIGNWSTGDSDTDTDTDTDTDGDGDSDLTGTLGGLRYLWLADWSNGTLSKIDTQYTEEVARYRIGPAGYFLDSWSTSVNPDGDAVVVNRICHESFPRYTLSSAVNGDGHSSVTKFAADKERCIDRNYNGVKDTSTGPNDVRAWDQDECMLWYTELDTTKKQICAGTVAWSHKNHVWVGTYETPWVYLLDGSNGHVLDDAPLPFGAWAGAVDSEGNFWMIDYPGDVYSQGFSEVGDHLMKVTSDLEITVYDVPNLLANSCNGSIAVDPEDRVWIAGDGRICWLNPGAEKVESHTFGSWTQSRFNGVVVGLQDTGSAGHLWLVREDGHLGKVPLAIDSGSLTMAREETISTQQTVGVGIDNQGFVWVITDRNNNTDVAYKIDPGTFGTVAELTLTTEHGPLGDMIGTQLWNVTQSGEQ